MNDAVELSIVMPCLNEAETLAACIRKAKLGGERAGVSTEIVLADNGSTDGSIEIAEKLGARVVHVKSRGYGNALRGGIESAHGKWIIMGDADDSYDFSEISGIVQKLRDGYDLVMGCRLPVGGGTILPGAMPWKNRWIGNPVLSFIGRLFFKCPAHDFHCGLRGFTKDAFEKMDLQTTGMEFASEMVIKATFKSLRIAEVPITLHPDGRSRAPHLNPWRDGWRHLRFMLLFNPRWLFFVPGIVMTLIGVAGSLLLAKGRVWIGGVSLDVGTLCVCCLMLLVGVQLLAFGCFTKVFSITQGLLPKDPFFEKVYRNVTLEKGVVVGGAVLAIGACVLVHALLVWKQAGFGELSYSDNLRRMVLSTTLVMLGLQVVFSSFFVSVLGLTTSRRG